MSDSTYPQAPDGHEVPQTPGVPDAQPAGTGPAAGEPDPTAVLPTYPDAAHGQAADAPSPYGQAPGAPTPYGQAPGAPTPYGQAPGAPTPYGQAPGAPAPYGQAPGAPTPYGQAPGAPTPYGQAPGAPTPYGQAPGTPTPYGQAPGAPTPYGQAPGTPGAPYGQGPGTPGAPTPHGQAPGAQPPYGQPPASMPAPGQPAFYAQASAQPAYGQPTGAPPAGTGFGPPGAYGAPGTPPPGWQPGPGSSQPTGSKKPKPGLVVGAGVGAVALLVAGIFGYGQLTGGGKTPGGGTTTAAAPAPATAGDAVKAYFDALSRGDAAAAKALLKDPPTEGSMLTDEVLKAATAAAPITGLAVTEDTASDYSATIPVTYTIGEREVSEDFYVTKAGNLWRLMSGTTSVNLGSLQPTETGLAINGVALTTESVDLFPGGYQLSTTNADYAVSSKQFVVESPNSSPDLYKATISLSKDALAGLQSATKTAFNACLKAKHDLVDAKCGLNFRKPSGGKVAKNAVTCSVKSGRASVEKAKFKLDYSDFGLATAFTSASLTCNVKATNGNRYVGYSSIYKATAQKSGDTWKVTFN